MRTKNILGNEILLTGGYEGETDVLARRADGSWEARADLPFKRYDHACMDFNLNGAFN